MAQIMGTFVMGKPRNNTGDKVYEFTVSERIQKFVKGQNGQGGGRQWMTEFYTVKVFTGNTNRLAFVQSLREGESVEIIGDLEASPYMGNSNQGGQEMRAGLTITPNVIKRPEMSKATKDALGIENGNGQGAQGAPAPNYPPQAPPPGYAAQPPPPGYAPPGYVAPPPGYAPPAPPPQGYPQQPPPGYAPQAPPPGYASQQPPPPGYAPQPHPGQPAPQPGYAPAPVDYTGGGDDFGNLAAQPD